MPAVLPNNEPRFIEEFIRTTPDAFNDQSPTGDPAATDPENGDWSPTVHRAMTFHVGLDVSLPASRNYAPRVIFGNTQRDYNFSYAIPVFASIIGAYPGVRFYFTDTDGLVIHYADSGAGLGTYHPANGYPLAPGMAPFEGYGTQNVVIENIDVYFPGFVVRNVADGTTAAPTTQEGRRGIICHNKCTIRDVKVYYAGWHGIHIDADVGRTYRSNANGVDIERVLSYGNGYSPGTQADLVTAVNPTGWRGYGSGLRANGGDANICTFKAVNCTWNAYADFHDSGFLGNHYVQPHAAPLGRPISQLEVDCYNDAVAAGGGATDAQTWCLTRMNPWGNAAGDIDAFAYILDNASARTTLSGPYTEGVVDAGSPPRAALVYGERNSVTIAGIGGRLEGFMPRYSGTFVSQFGLQVENTLDFDQTTWGGSTESGIVPNMSIGRDGPIGEMLGFYVEGVPSAANVPRIKYRPHIDESAPDGTVSYGGSFLLDFANLSSRVIAALGRNSARVYSREIENGRFSLPQAFYLGRIRVNITSVDPSGVTPSAAGSFIAHGNGPGDQTGDLAIWTSAPFTAGSAFVFQCVGTVGAGATWEPLLVVPTP